MGDGDGEQTGADEGGLQLGGLGGGGQVGVSAVENVEIRRVFDAIHRQVLEEISVLDDAVFNEATDSHSRFSTKGGSLTWCAEHEMMHAGQIGLLRRLLGQPPLW